MKFIVAGKFVTCFHRTCWCLGFSFIIKKMFEGLTACLYEMEYFERNCYSPIVGLKFFFSIDKSIHVVNFAVSKIGMKKIIS